MLTELCAELNNWFIHSDEDKHCGVFEIHNGSIVTPIFPPLLNGQYFRIDGSVLNDGVYQYPTSELSDEVFDGAVWAMAVPPAVIALSEEIAEYNKSDEAKPTAYASESFGGYSYAKATTADGKPMTWQHIFASRLNKWRKLSCLY